MTLKLAPLFSECEVVPTQQLSSKSDKLREISQFMQIRGRYSTDDAHFRTRPRFYCGERVYEVSGQSDIALESYRANAKIAIYAN